MQKTMTCLWMEDWIEEAVNFYVSLFDNSRITEVSRYNEATPEMAGKVLVIGFELAGTKYMALNGGPVFKPNEAMSIFVNCKDQAEVDRLWTAIVGNGGEESQCGWCRDRYGFSWQIVPEAMSRYITGPDKAGATRAMQAMLTMKKLDLATLERAYAGA
ncbi:MAG TPA: VOC family protein [Devosia sp.]|nr:VOC family protein [Devosia sp.]